MHEQIRRLFEELDEALKAFAGEGERLDLYQLGRSALILHHGLPLSTKDVDMVQMRTPLEEKAIELFGKGTANATRLGLYLELVPQGLPPVPQGFRSRCTEIHGAWQVLRLWRLDDNDLAATKIRSFRAQDRADLEFLCDENLVTEEGLLRSVDLAFAFADKDERKEAFATLQRVIDYLAGRRPSV